MIRLSDAGLEHACDIGAIEALYAEAKYARAAETELADALVDVANLLMQCAIGEHVDLASTRAALEESAAALRIVRRQS